MLVIGVGNGGGGGGGGGRAGGALGIIGSFVRNFHIGFDPDYECH